MPDSPFITCANAIVYDLNAAVENNTFNREFEARVLWAKRTLKLPDLKVLRVDLAPISWTKCLLARGVWGHILRYHLGVRKLLLSPEEEQTGEIADSEITDLVTLLEDLSGFFMPKQPNADATLSQFENAKWAPETTIEDNKPATEIFINWEHLRDFSQFTGFFELTYEATT